MNFIRSSEHRSPVTEEKYLLQNKVIQLSVATTVKLPLKTSIIFQLSKPAFHFFDTFQSQL